MKSRKMAPSSKYEGHDQPRVTDTPAPQSVDQPKFLPGGGLAENAKFHRAAQEFKAGKKVPNLVRVYERYPEYRED
jgi:hypothetical protein